MKRYNERMDFVAYEIAQILQNVSNNQPITKWHIKQAVAVAYLSFYPGKTMYTTSGVWGPFYGPGWPHGKIYYVTCNNEGKASVKWCQQFQFGGWGSGVNGTPQTIFIGANNLEDDRSSVRIKSNASPTEIYPSFSINPGETKIIVEICAYHTTEYQKVGGGNWGSPKEEFGFFLISPKPARTQSFYFEKVIIFTPKPGLFSETPPQ